MFSEKQIQPDLDLINRIITLTDNIHKTTDLCQILEILENAFNRIPFIEFSFFCFPVTHSTQLPPFSKICRDCDNRKNPFSEARKICKYKKLAAYKVLPLDYSSFFSGNFIFKPDNQTSYFCYEPYIMHIIKIFSCKAEKIIYEKEYHKIKQELEDLERESLTRYRETEAELTRYRLELETIFNSDPVSIWFKDKAGRVIRVNRAAAQSVGLSINAIEGKSIHDLFPREDAAIYFQDDFEVINTGIPKHNLLRNITNINGERRLIYVDIVPYRDSENTICGVLAFMRDITDLKQIEAKLTDTLERLQERESTISSLYDSAKAVLQKESFKDAAQVIFNHLKTVIKAQSGYVALLSDDGNENKVLFLDSGGLPCTVDPNLPMPIRGLRETAYRSGKPVYHNNFSTSAFINLMPPSHVSLKNVLFIPLNVTGKVVGLIGLANKEEDFDIKDGAIGAAFAELAAIALRNSYAIDSLKESEQKYRQLVDTLQEGIWVVDKESITTFVNPEMGKMLGYTVEEIIGKPLFSFTRNPDIDFIKQKIKHRKQGIMEKYDSEFIRKDGTHIYTSVAATPLLDNNGNYIGTLAGITNLTERKKAEKQLENSLKEKEILLQEIHHRVKNNLMVISSLIGLQIRRVKNKHIQSILDDTKNRVYTMSLIHQLLYQSKNFNQINLSRYIHDLIYYLIQSFKINADHINIKIDVEEIRLNLNQAIPCGLIINELVSNSIKYAFPDEQQGEINITLYSENNNIILNVKDNGAGFPADFNFHNTESLGLFLIRSFVEQLNGKSEFLSYGGVTFTVVFPGIKS